MSLQFTDDGILAPKDYPMTIEQLMNSLLVRGPRPVPHGIIRNV